MLARSEVEAILAGGRELRNLEVKGPGSRGDSHLMAKVIRAALSMGNLRDGGYVLIGLEDRRLEELQPGLTDDELAGWNFDAIARKFSACSDPPIVFDVAQLELSSGSRVVIIRVSEFVDVPHMCARQHDGVLRKGALYVRSRGAAETVEVSDPVEMREVIDLATEKALRRYVDLTRQAGLELRAVGDLTVGDEIFEQQRRGAFE